MCSSCHQNGKYGNFMLLFCGGLHGLVNKCMRAACAARLFLLTQPIKFLISGLAVAFPVDDTKAALFLQRRQHELRASRPFRNACERKNHV